jgi:magnesium-transporting ATPase (P-type)
VVNESEVLLGDPMEVALVEMARAAIAEFPPCRRLDEIPFDAERMRHSLYAKLQLAPFFTASKAIRRRDQGDDYGGAGGD